MKIPPELLEETFQEIHVKTKESKDLASEVPDHRVCNTVSIKQVTKYSLNSRGGKIRLSLLTWSSTCVQKEKELIILETPVEALFLS